MSSTISATPITGDNRDNGGNGIGPAVYYGAIAVALALIICVTILSRILYRRKQRENRRAQFQREREAQERRGEATGLPTYHEARVHNIGLPHYAVDYQPPPNLPPPAPVAPVSPATEHHFHFHFPSLPAALHLRPRRPQDAEMGIPMVTSEPPKYEHSYLDFAPDAVVQLESQPAPSSVPYESPFIHPEELRRNRGRSLQEGDLPEPTNDLPPREEAALVPVPSSIEAISSNGQVEAGPAETHATKPSA